MYIKRNYSFLMTINWSKKPFIIGFLYSLVICAIAFLLKINFSIPWQPLSIIGIAVAFYLGFKNNSSYDRTWEARKIWGSIVNNSRSFAAALIAFGKGENVDVIKKEIIYRHIAWLITLTHQLRLTREWEHKNERIRDMFADKICEDYYDDLSASMKLYISEEEFELLKTKSNIATQLLAKQSLRLQEIRDQEVIEDFRHMELQAFITSFYEDQGKSERIKNFPFPRQYASTALWLTVVFCALVPFGMLDIFNKLDFWMFWLCPFMTGLVIWIYFLMEKIGDYSENPFEGTYNDVPISTIARGIEIDIREMINDENIPAPLKDINGFQL